MAEKPLKGLRAAIIAGICLIVLVTLPLIFLCINGAISGSFDWYPGADDIAAGRAVYAALAALLVAVDIALAALLRAVLKRRP